MSIRNSEAIGFDLSSFIMLIANSCVAEEDWVWKGANVHRPDPG